MWIINTLNSSSSLFFKRQVTFKKAPSTSAYTKPLLKWLRNNCNDKNKWIAFAALPFVIMFIFSAWKMGAHQFQVDQAYQKHAEGTPLISISRDQQGGNTPYLTNAVKSVSLSTRSHSFNENLFIKADINQTGRLNLVELTQFIQNWSKRHSTTGKKVNRSGQNLAQLHIAAELLSYYDIPYYMGTYFSDKGTKWMDIVIQSDFVYPNLEYYRIPCKKKSLVAQKDEKYVRLSLLVFGGPAEKSLTLAGFELPEFYFKNRVDL